MIWNEPIDSQSAYLAANKAYRFQRAGSIYSCDGVVAQCHGSSVEHAKDSASSRRHVCLKNHQPDCRVLHIDHYVYVGGQVSRVTGVTAVLWRVGLIRSNMSPAWERP